MMSLITISLGGRWILTTGTITILLLKGSSHTTTKSSSRHIGRWTKRRDTRVHCHSCSSCLHLSSMVMVMSRMTVHTDTNSPSSSCKPEIPVSRVPIMTLHILEMVHLLSLLFLMLVTGLILT
jgi:hypothetical protein